jgi:hypothetical protein
MEKPFLFESYCVLFYFLVKIHFYLFPNGDGPGFRTQALSQLLARLISHCAPVYSWVFVFSHPVDFPSAEIKSRVRPFAPIRYCCRQKFACPSHVFGRQSVLLLNRCLQTSSLGVSFRRAHRILCHREYVSFCRSFLCAICFFCRSQVSQDLAPFSYCMGTRVMVLSCGSCSCSCVRNSVPCLSVIGPVIGIRDEDASCSRIIFDSRSHFSLGVPPGGSDSRHIFFRGFSSSVTLCSSGA